MNSSDHPRSSGRGGRLLPAVLIPVLCISATAQICLNAGDMEEPTRAVLVSTAKRYFDMAARGDAAGLRQNAIASVASDFAGIENAIKDNHTAFSGAQAAPRPPYLLTAEGTAPLPRAEFLCGVFGRSGQTSSSAVFVLPNLPPGNYAVVVLDVTAAAGPQTLSFVLEQQGSDWKLGGFYAKPAQIAGHDANWFTDRAREFKAKGELRNAWFYYLEARDLAVPLPFMSTLITDRLYDEMQNLKPADLPPADLAAGGKTFKPTEIFPIAVGNDFDVVVKYQSADISNTQQTFQNNMAVIKALVGKYPEFRNAFAAVVARAVDSSGRDYGSLLAMKDIK